MKAPAALSILMLVLASAAGTSVQGQAQGSSPLGRWRTTAQNGVVEITRCGAELCGRLIDADPLRRNPQQRDVRNREPALRQRALQGVTVLHGFSGGPEVWRGGPRYDPASGQGARHGSLTLIDANTLSVQGCIAPLLCRTQTWKRLP